MKKKKYELNNLTVFLITTNEDTYQKSKEAIRNQNSLFKIKEIKNVYPMSSAFQYMPDNCDTDYFIQLDADMILEHDSIYKLYTEIIKTSFLTYRISGKLYEEGFGIGGHIKCWKKNIFKYFSFKDCRTVDRNFHNRVKWFGFKNKTINAVLGKHIPRHSMLSEFLKTKSDIEKWKFLGRDVKKYAIPLLQDIISQNNLSKFFGLLISCLSPWSRIILSKNINYEKKIFNLIKPYILQSSSNNYNLKKLNINNIQHIFSNLYSSKSPDLKQKNTLVHVIEIISSTNIVKPVFLEKLESIE